MQNEHAQSQDDSNSADPANAENTGIADIADGPADDVNAVTPIEETENLPVVESQAFATSIDVVEAKRALEAVLMAAAEPMPLNELKRIFDGELSGDTVRNMLEELRSEWSDRSVELAVVASGYRFRVKPQFQKYLDRLSNEKPPRYSRAVLETLAIIVYRQPVTRGDIEDIRGVQVSPHILKTLQDRGWIDEIGHKEVPGRPALFATTRHFLDDLNLRSLEELPPLHELQATLDMTQTGAALSAGQTPSLPGVAHFEEGPSAADGGQQSAGFDELSVSNAKSSSEEIQANISVVTIPDAIPNDAIESDESKPS